MPYRIDIACPPPDALDVLVELGALDVEQLNGGLAVIVPDDVTQERLAGALGRAVFTVSEAVGRDTDSVWLVSPQSVRAGGITLVSPEMAASSEVVRLTDSTAFGTGHHPTTALCIEALEEILAGERFDCVLDVGTGSGVLALAALKMGVERAVGVDIDADVLRVAAENARLNDLADRLQLRLGGPEVVSGQWPLVVANVLAAPLIEMAPVLVQRVRKGGWLVLSGIAGALEDEVRQAYRHCGMGCFEVRRRPGWRVLVGRG